VRYCLVTRITRCWIWGNLHFCGLFLFLLSLSARNCAVQRPRCSRLWILRIVTRSESAGGGSFVALVNAAASLLKPPNPSLCFLTLGCEQNGYDNDNLGIVGALVRSVAWQSRAPLLAALGAILERSQLFVSCLRAAGPRGRSAS
jgi:hypothetical protein